MKYDLFIDFHTLSVVEIGYHIRYTSSIADYFDSILSFYSRIFLFLLSNLSPIARLCYG